MTASSYGCAFPDGDQTASALREAVAPVLGKPVAFAVPIREHVTIWPCHGIYTDDGLRGFELRDDDGTSLSRTPQTMESG